MMHPFGGSVTVWRDDPGGKDAYGDPVAGSTASIVLDDCAWSGRSSGQQRGSTEPNARGQEGVVTDLTLYAPAGSDIRRTDRVEVAGLMYEVQGDPRAPHNPFTGWNPGVTVQLRRAEG